MPYRARGNIRKRSVFLSAPIFVWKIYPQNSYLANLPYGVNKWKCLLPPTVYWDFYRHFTLKNHQFLPRSWTKIKKRWPFFQLSPKILWSFFHKTASQVLFRCVLPHPRPLQQLPRHAVRKRKQAARIILPPSGFPLSPFRETERLALFVPVFRNVFPRLHRRPDRNLVVSRIISP